MKNSIRLLLILKYLLDHTDKTHAATVWEMNESLKPHQLDCDRRTIYDYITELQVRVDLYNVDGKIYFGEMTFTNGNGFDKIVPDEYDEILGSLWKLPNRTQ